ncbi:MAG TPA: M23 family metallopeptidase [Allosphingosinicella sp.]|jgi:murein DD-endopeptidase MepM/ murein hydrolase activator NlpD
MSSSLLLALLLAKLDPVTAERARAANEALLTGDPALLAARMTPEMLAAIGGAEGARRFAAEIRAALGPELEVLQEQAFPGEGSVLYYRESRFERVPRVTVNWVFAPDGRISGAWVGPSTVAAETPYLGYQTKAALRLPFGRPADGGWYVSWGGRDAIRNYHVIAADQRFAYDFLLYRGGYSFKAGGRRNEDHYCWNQPVLAPAAGRVVSAVGDVPDNAAPGQKTPGVTPPGNHVVIDHDNGERSLLAHFRQGTLKVKAGQKVAAGQLLGLCGNSGNSSQPHVHYHLQTGKAFGEGLGLPAFFNGYEADGVPVTRGEPQRGQVVVPAR